eukprot:3932752-Rhodomonas_salina.1
MPNLRIYLLGGSPMLIGGECGTVISLAICYLNTALCTKTKYHPAPIVVERNVVWSREHDSTHFQFVGIISRIGAIVRQHSEIPNWEMENTVAGGLQNKAVAPIHACA